MEPSEFHNKSEVPIFLCPKGRLYVPLAQSVEHVTSWISIRNTPRGDMSASLIFMTINHGVGSSSLPRYTIYAVVVQLVEPQISNLVVAGSSPVYRSKFAVLV